MLFLHSDPRSGKGAYVRCCDSKTGELLWERQGGSAAGVSGGYAILANGLKNMEFFEITSGEAAMPPPYICPALTEVELTWGNRLRGFSPDGSELLISWISSESLYADSLCALTLATGEVRTLMKLGAEYLDLAFWLADGSILHRVWNGDVYRFFPAHPQTEKSYSNPGASLSVIQCDHKLQNFFLGWDRYLGHSQHRSELCLVTKNGTHEFRWESERVPSHAVFSPDNRFLCITDSEGGLTLVDVREEKIVYKSLEAANGAISPHAEFSLDGQGLYLFGKEDERSLSAVYRIVYELEAPGPRADDTPPPEEQSQRKGLLNLFRKKK